ncbi:MAG TPA: hypothetical protein VMF60_07400 [Acidimicrobiales bacterium]|nr:hypothetical protein [Acidimicrobiales bacterium]
MAAVLATASAAYASLGPGVTVTASLKSGTDMTFAGNINGAPITVSCTSFSGSGTTGSSPSDSVTLNGAPSITGCTDSLGGTDTIKTNTTNGNWKLSSNKKGTKFTLAAPKAAATFTSSLISSCVITAFPAKAGKVNGKFNSSADTDTVKKAKIPTQGSGCSSTTATTNAVVTFSPNPGKPPYG